MDLKKIREKKGLSQEEVARAIGKDRSLISKIENGSRPSIETAKAIATYLNFDWILFFE